MTKLTLTEARKLAVAGQLLDAPQPRSMLETIDWLGGLQMDPTAAVARSERLVLWSRLGTYDVAELERLRWGTRELLDYWAYIVPASDYAIHRETMRRYPRGAYARTNYVHEWLAANAGFRFRLEIYVPKAKREYGYFVLPFLHGHELVGRIDPLFDRKTGVLHVNAVHWEPDAPRDARPALKTAVTELAEWLGAGEVAYAKPT